MEMIGGVVGVCVEMRAGRRESKNWKMSFMVAASGT